MTTQAVTQSISSTKIRVLISGLTIVTVMVGQIAALQGAVIISDRVRVDRRLGGKFEKNVWAGKIEENGIEGPEDGIGYTDTVGGVGVDEEKRFEILKGLIAGSPTGTKYVVDVYLVEPGNSTQTSDRFTVTIQANPNFPGNFIDTEFLFRSDPTLPSPPSGAQTIPETGEFQSLTAALFPSLAKDAWPYSIFVMSDGDVPPAPNGTKSAPKSGQTNQPLPQMSFNAVTGTLSFSDTIIDYANLVGDTSFDPAFSSDPILGATIHLTDFTLSRAVGNGFLFTDGTLNVSNAGTSLLAADIPELLIDDDAVLHFGHNVFAPLNLNELNASASAFITRYEDFWIRHPEIPPEFYATTVDPVTDMIRNGQSFTVAVNDGSISFCTVPEPSTFLIFSGGVVCFLCGSWRLRKQNGSEKEDLVTD